MRKKNKKQQSLKTPRPSSLGSTSCYLAIQKSPSIMSNTLGGLISAFLKDLLSRFPPEVFGLLKGKGGGFGNLSPHLEKLLKKVTFPTLNSRDIGFGSIRQNLAVSCDIY